MYVVLFVQTTIILNKEKNMTHKREEKDNYNHEQWLCNTTAICIITDQFFSVLLESGLDEYRLLIITTAGNYFHYQLRDTDFPCCKNNFLLVILDS